MKKFFLLFALVFSLGSVYAQQDIHDPNAKPRKLDGSFHAIEVSDGIQVFLSAGQSEQLAVSMSDASYDDKLKTVVEDGVLKIYYKRESVKFPKGKKLDLKAYVSFVKLDKLEANAGSSVHLSGTVSVEQLSVKLTSGALMDGQLEANVLSIVQNSGAVAKLTGKASSISLDLSSGAMFRSPDFVSTNCTAEASSGASIRIGIDRELNARASSGGSIHYNGAAVIRDIKVNSGGVVKKVEKTS